MTPVAAAADAKPAIAAFGRTLGFDIVRFTHARPFEQEARVFSQRARDGLLGQWRYTDDMIRRCCTPEIALPGARSIVCTATSYAARDPGSCEIDALHGVVSTHAWGRDYHRVIGERLRELARFIEARADGVRCLPCVDTGPLIDRAAAVRAGIGWYGKNANVLTKRFGSWVLLGAVITTLELQPDEPLRTNCGRCETCIPSCPTGAIGPDGAVDSRRCISDLTQLRTPIPRELRKAIGKRFWGCDDCQTPCPVNERQRERAAGGRPDAPPKTVDLPAVLRMTKSQFRSWFGSTSMAWRGKAVLQRNAAVALGNSNDPRAVDPLIDALTDPKPLVRGHAAWALGELGGTTAESALQRLLEREDDPWAREEAEIALQRVGSLVSILGSTLTSAR